MGLEHRLIESIELVGRVIGHVPDKYQEVAYPILLEATIREGLGLSAYQKDTSAKEGDGRYSNQEIISSPVNELLARVKPDRLIGAVLLICAHLDVHSETITAETVRIQFGQTKLKKPQNPADMLSNLVRQGFLTPIGKQGRSTVYEMTSLGREAVQSQLEEVSE